MTQKIHQQNYIRNNWRIQLKKSLIKEIRAFAINPQGAKEERAQKSKQIYQKELIALKKKDKNSKKFIWKPFIKSKIRNRQVEKEHKLQNDIYIVGQTNRNKQKIRRQRKIRFNGIQRELRQKLVTERKQQQRELAGDEFRRQQLELQFKTMRELFITKTTPHLLWKPVKTNEGMNLLKEYTKESILIIY